MAQVTVYSAPECSSCNDAKTLLSNKGVAYEDVNVMENPSLQEEITRILGGELSLPQVVIDGRLVGGYERLQELEQKGVLDQLLTSKKACCRGLPPDECGDMHRGMGKDKEKHAH